VEVEPTTALNLWEWLSAAGGTLALTFIVGLGLGLASMAIIFLGSSVVVLERFARVRKGLGGIVFFALLLASASSAMLAHEQYPELSSRPWSEWFEAFRGIFFEVVLWTAAAITLCLAAFRYVSSVWLARASIIWLGLSVQFYVGAIGQLGLAFAPLLLCGLFALGLARRRRRSGPSNGAGLLDGPSEFENELRLLCVLLAGGPVWALVLPESSIEMATLASQMGSAFVRVVVLGLLPLACAGLVAIRSGPEWFIAVRYLVARRRQVFISAITAICVSGIAAGVWLIITVLSVMNGFEQTWREEIIGNRAHFTVHSGFGPFSDYEAVQSLVEKTDGVTAVSPYLDAEGMVRSKHGDIFAVRVRGVDPARVGHVTDIREDIRAGSLDDLISADGAAPEEPPGLIVGSQLASAVGISVGENLLLISPYGGAPTPLGPAPRLKRFKVVGVFQSSFFQYDEVYTYTSLAAAQDFRRAGDVVDGLEASTTDFYRSRRVAKDVIAALDYPFYTRDWKEYFPAFFQALKTERVMMFVLLSMVMVVAAFIIVATLIMMIMEKSNDIAILKAMGAEDASIERIFAVQGTLIGLAGTVLGVLCSVAVTNQLDWIQRQIEGFTGIDTLPAEIYQFSTLPSQMNPVDVVVIATIAMVLSLGATLLPSRQGSRVDPVEGLRHE